MAGDTLLLGNPTAQSGRARALIERAVRGLEARGLSTRFLSTSAAGGTTETVRDALDRAPEAPDAPGVGVARVVALGGDGTFADVARGVLAARPSARVPMGLIPAGTANDQARSFGLGCGGESLEENLDVIARGNVQPIDAGRVRRVGPGGDVDAETLFFDSVGWGMHPEVLSQRNRDRALIDNIPLVRELYRDQAVYAGAVLNRYLASWVEPTKFEADVRVDGRPYHLGGLTDLIVNATPIYAGAWVLARDALVDDGRFELVPIQGRRDWFLKAVHDLAAVPLVGDGLDAFGVAATGTIQGTSFDLRLSRPGRPGLAAQVDGEEWLTGAHFIVDVLPRALPFITRAGWVPPWRSA